MHLNVLTQKQKDLLPLLQAFSEEFGLVGGTAIALQLGHRKSIDFDLFKKRKLDILSIRKTINQFFSIEKVRIENQDEYTIQVHDVQMTFLNFPFDIKYDVKLKDACAMPDLLTLATMKAYALGRRAKWKDYVDLYFIFKGHSFVSVVNKAKEIFKGEFNEKLFREQLAYHEDIDYSEKIEYLPHFSIDDGIIKQKLIEISLNRS
ncbi:nucleotidyl transferase AbiEii/AbiGii toxin family protein [Candidatus Woesebacteria bacterium]|nr:nucleotidyl transferase AbiEii/AbiGii toxin family protein [Candidatus Woesebacteria bacterium]